MTKKIVKARFGENLILKCVNGAIEISVVEAKSNEFVMLGAKAGDWRIQRTPKHLWHLSEQLFT